jgi:ABC-type Na+ efflux pump permease subunit
VRFVLACARKDLRRLRRDPIALLAWLGIPVIVSLLLGLVFGGGAGPAPHGVLLVADEDRTAASALLTRVFGYGELTGMVSVEPVERAAGRKRLDRGGASALLIVPQGFEKAWRSGRPVELILVKNPSQRIIPSVIEETLGAVAEGLFGRKRADGEWAPALFETPPVDIETTVVPVDSRPAPDYRLLLLHGALFMAAFFMTMGLAGGVWKERTQGALRRLAASPASVTGYLAGKGLAVAVVLAGLGVFGLAAANWLAQAPLRYHGLALLWVVLSGAAMFLWFLLLQTAASTERAAHLLASFFTLPLVMLGGSLFPFEMMPGGLASIGRLTPNGWALSEYKSILDGSIGAGRLALDFLGASAAAALAMWLSARRLRARFLT